ncbi:MAG: type II toxin-antitoxin system Phd/YefM family antitoxin [Spirochaetes bacterium]|nr:type II toxin-antitoxin system Phd/YefM family antitoxin [Spirochaetota bacterium]
MLIESNDMIPITKLQKQLTKKIRDVAQSGKSLFILKNNEMQAVILPVEEYELLQHAEEIVEHFEIADTVETRMSKYNKNKNTDWEIVKKKYEL